jgi:hypothetical protein
MPVVKSSASSQFRLPPERMDAAKAKIMKETEADIANEPELMMQA